MTDTTTATPAANDMPLDEAAVLRWLQANPDFLTRNPELLASADAPGDDGAVVSFAARQVNALRGREKDLQARLDEMLGAGRQNERALEQLHRLYVLATAEQPLPALLASLRERLLRDFKLDVVHWLWFGAPPAAEVPGLVVLKPGAKRLAPLQDRIQEGGVTAGRLRANQLRAAFGEHAESVHSAGLIVLGAAENPLAVLALGSHEEHRFSPTSGNDLLARLADLLGGILRLQVAAG